MAARITIEQIDAFMEKLSRIVPQPRRQLPKYIFDSSDEGDDEVDDQMEADIEKAKKALTMIR